MVPGPAGGVPESVAEIAVAAPAPAGRSVNDGTVTNLKSFSNG
jgi:hypothetical protein